MSKLDEAKTTCDGLHRLMILLNGAAVDLDKGGESAHELLALLATTNECVSNLSAQLESIQQPADASNISEFDHTSEANTQLV